MKHVPIWITLLATANSWVVEFTPNSNNIAVQLITTCYAGKKPYFSLNRHDIDGQMLSRVSFRRQPTPAGENCRVVAEVLRNDTDDYRYEYVSQSAVSSQTE